MAKVGVLKFILGVPSTLELGLSSVISEPNKRVIDFLTDDWQVSYSPNQIYQRGITSVKGGGVKSESAASDGSFYLAMPLDDVSETITLISASPRRAEAFGDVSAFFMHVRLFQTEDSAPFVPYIEVRESVETGSRFALIKDMSLAYAGDPFDCDGGTTTLTITFTREGLWRWLPPSYNPRVFALEDRYGLKPYAGDTPPTGFYNYESLSLIDAVDDPLDSHLFSSEIGDMGLVPGSADEFKLRNHVSIAQGALIQDSKNFIIIPKERIKGDAPMLTFIAFYRNTNNEGRGKKLHISRQVDYFDQFFGREITGTQLAFSSQDNDVSGTVATNLTSEKTIAAPGTGIAFGVNWYYQNIVYNAVVSGGDVIVMSWDAQSLKRRAGRYAVFVRMNRISGTLTGDGFTLSFVSDGTGTDEFVRVDLPFVPEAQTSTASDAPGPPLYYLGEVSIPPAFGTYYPQSLTGAGVFPDGTGQFRIELISNGNTGSVTYRFYDILLMPIEQYAMITNATPFREDPVPAPYFILDNTGYMDRAKGEGLAVGAMDIDRLFASEMRGQFITLIPGYDNYIYFLLEGEDGDGHPTASISMSNNRVFLNGVPRYHGLRGDD